MNIASALLLATLPALHAQTGQQVLLVVNRSDAVSRQVGDYYRSRRSVPLMNVCALQSRAGEEITWETYVVQIERPIAACLEKNGLRERILYIALTMGVPLKIQGGGSRMSAEYASVDSELTLLYGKMKGAAFVHRGVVPNPFFMQRDAPFRHPQFPIYLVTRLAAYDLAGVKAMIDRSLAARNRGKFVLDLNAPDGDGNRWLETAAMLLPRERVVVDATAKVLYGQKDVIGYASWGSNDGNRKRRWLGFEWLPGAIATEFVSTNARTLKRPPEDWNLTTYEDRRHFFAGSPQSLTADLIQDGATGASGNTYEPLLTGCVRPDYLLPAYYQGRNLAESYYLALPFLSWQGVVLGDPLCSLGKP
jgi:uncharacterized protein (TIGR03790 family)